MLTRRQFNKQLSAASGVLLGSSLVFGQDVTTPSGPIPKMGPQWRGVLMGSSTISLTPMDIYQCLDVFRQLGLQEVEFHSNQIERLANASPAPQQSPARAGGASAGRGGGRNPMSPEAREKLRNWRISQPDHEIEAIGQQFRDAGILATNYALTFPEDLSDAEIEGIYRLGRALGASSITAATYAQEMIDRLDPVAKKFGMRTGIHTQGVMTSPDQLDACLKGKSDYMGITLDIAHFSAAGGDSVAFLRSRHDQIVDVHLHDSKIGGPDVPMGEGDTPVKGVLQTLRDEKWQIPANIEWEVRNTPDRVAALRGALEYCKAALNS